MEVGFADALSTIFRVRHVVSHISLFTAKITFVSHMLCSLAHDQKFCNYFLNNPRDGCPNDYCRQLF